MPPLAILLIAVGVVLFLIIKLRINAFIALIVAATTVGALSPVIPMGEVMPAVAAAFGRVCGSIGIVIAFAAVVGQCLMESGAADKIVRVFQRALGNASPAYSLVGSGFVLSIPVFFDTVFYLLAPLARASRVRSGKNYALYLMAIAAGATATHALVPPTPGPLAMSAFLNIDIGMMILMGLAVSVPMAATGMVFAFFWDKRLNIPLRDAPGVTVQQLEKMAEQDEANLPGMFESILPVILPVLLITSNTLVSAMGVEGPLKDFTGFVGDPNFALLAAMVVAIRTLAKQKGASLLELGPSIERALSSAGLIILITAGGGAFGGMLVRSGIGDTLAQTSQSMGLPVLALAFVLPAMLKVAQGSGTVSMITASSILAPLAAEGLPFHPVYLACMIGSGSKLGSWMNDSGFWVYAKMSGLTETETLKTWSILLAVLAFGGGAATAILAAIFPMPQ